MKLRARFLFGRPKPEPYLVPEQLDPIDRWCRRFAIVGFACLLIFFTLYGCSSYGHQWAKTKPASVKPWLYVTALDPDRACRMFGAKSKEGERINGCAQWRPVNCLILLPENPPKWLIDHEEKHCEGWTHE